jgi:hypothetical protein
MRNRALPLGELINVGVRLELTTKFSSRVGGVARGRQMGGELVELAASLCRDAQMSSARHREGGWRADYYWRQTVAGVSRP